MSDLMDERDSRVKPPSRSEVDLEAIWDAPYPAEPKPAPARVRGIDEIAPGRLGRIITFGWALFVFSIFFEPAPNPDAVTPVWANALVAGFFVALGAAGILGVLRGGRLAFGIAALGGTLGLALAIGCVATDHHPAGWWAWELTATTLLTALAVAGLRRSRND